MVFNLRDDIGERKELANQSQDVARRLRPMLAQWEEDVNKEALANEPEVAAQLRQQEGGRAGGAVAPAGGNSPAGRGRGTTPAGRGSQ